MAVDGVAAERGDGQQREFRDLYSSLVTEHRTRTKNIGQALIRSEYSGERLQNYTIGIFVSWHALSFARGRRDPAGRLWPDSPAAAVEQSSIINHPGMLESQHTTPRSCPSNQPPPNPKTPLRLTSFDRCLLDWHLNDTSPQW